MPNIYIIAGCNGAGKTTCAFSILPQVLDCNEFVNADLIAKGISPFNESSVNFEAGRIMLTRIKELIELKQDFVFETTLSTISYVKLLNQAKLKGYSISLHYFWLDSPELAIDRVKNRVLNGGHDIPEDVIIRRYHKSIRNLNKYFFELVNEAYIYNNSGKASELVANKIYNEITISNNELWTKIRESN